MYHFNCQQKLGPHANVGFSKAMSAGWLEVNKTAEGGPRVIRKVRPTYFPGKKTTHTVDFFRNCKGNENWFKKKIEQFKKSGVKLKGRVEKVS